MAGVKPLGFGGPDEGRHDVDQRLLAGVPGRFALVVSESRELRFEAWMTRAPVVVGGYGGWQKTARPRRRALTEWIGREGLSVQIDFHIQIEGDLLPHEVESHCRRLDMMAGQPLEAGHREPPLIKVVSDPPNLMPYGYGRSPNRDWFVESLTWDEETVTYNSYGNRSAAAGQLVVSEFVADHHLERLSPVKRHKRRKGGISRSGPGGKGRSKVRWYTVRKGDTLISIAASQLGDARRWHEIAKLNKIRDPKSIKVGQRLRLP